MRRILTVLGILVICFALAAPAIAGNGAPSGYHFNLNIVGVPKNKNVDMDNAAGHVIFVDLTGKTAIRLSEGDDFAVLDKNGTDGEAVFQLPNPDPNNDLTTEYSVYARALGKPKGEATITPYIVDEYGNIWVSVGSVTLKRSTGKSTFTNVTRDLLYIWYDFNDDGTLEHLPLFGDDAYDYFWDYDNNGLKLAQLRFYWIPTTIKDTP